MLIIIINFITFVVEINVERFGPLATTEKNAKLQTHFLRLTKSYKNKHTFILFDGYI